MKVADLSVEEFENIIHNILEEEIEDFYFMLDPTIRAKIEEGLKDVREGRSVSLDKILERSIRKRFLNTVASGSIEDD